MGTAADCGKVTHLLTIQGSLLTRTPVWGRGGHCTESAISQNALQDLHTRPKTSSAGTYHHPFVPYLGWYSGYQSRGISKTSFHSGLRSACSRLWSGFPNRFWQGSFTSNVGFEFEMFSLKTFLWGCLHDVHIRYFFDPLLPQGMEV